ncbi:unnamed protein product, partial [Effrenium voratum]
DRDETGCRFSLMPLDVPPPRGPLFIFGDPFLRRFVTIYDKSGPAVGFAVSKQKAMDELEASKLIVTSGGEEYHQHTKAPSSLASPMSVGLSAGYMTDDTASDSVSDSVSDRVSDRVSERVERLERSAAPSEDWSAKLGGDIPKSDSPEMKSEWRAAQGRALGQRVGGEDEGHLGRRLRSEVRKGRRRPEGHAVGVHPAAQGLTRPREVCAPSKMVHCWLVATPEQASSVGSSLTGFNGLPVRRIHATTTMYHK